MLKNNETPKKVNRGQERTPLLEQGNTQWFNSILDSEYPFTTIYSTRDKVGSNTKIKIKILDVHPWD